MVVIEVVIGWVNKIMTIIGNKLLSIALTEFDSFSSDKECRGEGCFHGELIGV